MPEQQLAGDAQATRPTARSGRGCARRRRAAAGQGSSFHRQRGRYRPPARSGCKAEFANTDKRAVARPVRQRQCDALRAEGRDRGAARARCRPARTGSTCSSSRPTRSSCATVKVARAEGDDAVVASGLKPGERSSPTASCGSPRARASASAGRRGSREHRRALRPPPGDDHAGHDRHPGLRHLRLPPAAGERAAERRFPDHPGSAPSCPGASPETMASAVATPLEKQFSTIAGIDSMTSTSSVRARRRSRCSSRSTATSTPPRRTCSRRSPSARQLPPTCRRRRRFRKVNPADFADPATWP